MNEEKWVLATVKRYLLDKLEKAQGRYEAVIITDILREILDMITKAEADAVLGTPAIVDDYVEQLLEKSKEVA